MGNVWYPFLLASSRPVAILKAACRCSISKSEAQSSHQPRVHPGQDLPPREHVCLKNETRFLLESSPASQQGWGCWFLLAYHFSLLNLWACVFVHKSLVCQFAEFHNSAICAKLSAKFFLRVFCFINPTKPWNQEDRFRHIVVIWGNVTADVTVICLTDQSSIFNQFWVVTICSSFTRENGAIVAAHFAHVFFLVFCPAKVDRNISLSDQISWWCRWTNGKHYETRWC